VRELRSTPSFPSHLRSRCKCEILSPSAAAIAIAIAIVFTLLHVSDVLRYACGC
jgi:hypothetical protein